LTNNQREGITGAFAGLDLLTADDIDDLVPLLSTGGKDSAGSSKMDIQFYHFLTTPFFTPHIIIFVRVWYYL